MSLRPLPLLLRHECALALLKNTRREPCSDHPLDSCATAVECESTPTLPRVFANNKDAPTAPPDTRHVSTYTPWPPRAVVAVSPRRSRRSNRCTGPLTGAFAPRSQASAVVALVLSEPHTPGRDSPRISARLPRPTACPGAIRHPGSSARDRPDPLTSAERARTCKRGKTQPTLALWPAAPTNAAPTASTCEKRGKGRETATEGGIGPSLPREGHCALSCAPVACERASLKIGLVCRVGCYGHFRE